jgi:type II secretory pathway component GspD/PulD (secretin)
VLGVGIMIAATAFGQKKDAAPAGSRKAEPKPARHAAEPKPYVEITSGPAEQAIRQSLQMKSDFEFKEAPLTDVIKRLKKLTQQEILIDNKALSDVGIQIDTPVTFSAHGIPVKSAMELMLKDLSLTWVITNDVMLITTPEMAENMLVTRVYPVYDLIAPKSSYRFEGMYVPGMTSGGFPRTLPSTDTSNGPTMGGMSGGMGGMGGRMGGGMFSVHDNLRPSGVSRNTNPVLLAQMLAPKPSSGTPGAPPSPQTPNQTPAPNTANGRQNGAQSRSRNANLTFTMDDLVDLITSTVKPTSWDEVGGPGSIMPTGGMLVVSQTQDVQEAIEKLLADLRIVSPGLRVVTIRAIWLQLDLNQLDQLLGSKPGNEAGIDRKALYEMAGKTKGYLGTITCLSGQTVHIASGRSRTAITSAIPVVGEQVGYQPVTSQPQSGALLQVTPQLLPSTQGALLDLCSSVTRAADKPETVHFYTDDARATKKTGENAATSRGITLDRVNMVVSQLATTLKVPLGEPTLVGGLTTEGSEGEQQAANTPQLYLFIEANAK